MQKSTPRLTFLNAIFLVLLIMVTATQVFAALVGTNQFLVDETQTEDGIETASNQIHVLKFTAHGRRQKSVEDYNRLKHFGKFIQFKHQKGCLNVRAQVLKRDSLTKAESTDADPCTIEKGLWFDQYTGNKYQSDDDVQVDHLVPLKEAFTAGAHEWSPAKRCVYGNFLEYKDHLKLMSGPENASKSDHTPADYMPSNSGYACDYLKSWLTVKLVWKLTLSETEVESIQKYVDRFSCEKKEFAVSKSEMNELRLKAQQLESKCPVRRRK